MREFNIESPLKEIMFGQGLHFDYVNEASLWSTEAITDTF